MRGNNKLNLDEVSFIRPILIVLLVFYHATCIHIQTGSWTLPKGVEELPIYIFAGKFAYAFLLESFVFISGYVWACQVERKGRIDDFFYLLKKKTIRLLVPLLIFGIPYILIIEKECINIPHLIEGPGHLWFLPMLFCCFIVGWSILKTGFSYKLITLFLFFVSLFSFLELPFFLSEVLYYIPFFFLGFTMFGYREIIRYNLTKKNVIFVWIMFLGAFFISVYVRGIIIKHTQNTFLIEECKVLSKLVYSLVGTMAFYMTSLYITSKYTLNDTYIKLGGMCMGVYIFQQFILKILYYDTIVPTYINDYILPLFVFFVTLSLSMLLTYLLRLNKLGRSII